MEEVETTSMGSVRTHDDPVPPKKEPVEESECQAFEFRMPDDQLFSLCTCLLLPAFMGSGREMQEALDNAQGFAYGIVKDAESAMMSFERNTAADHATPDSQG